MSARRNVSRNNIASEPAMNVLVMNAPATIDRGEPNLAAKGSRAMRNCATRSRAAKGRRAMRNRAARSGRPSH
jgi:hypothetical protein